MNCPAYELPPTLSIQGGELLPDNAEVDFTLLSSGVEYGDATPPPPPPAKVMAKPAKVLRPARRPLQKGPLVWWAATDRWSGWLA